jgi:hypothetical protein
VRIGKHAARLVREAAVLGYVNGAVSSNAGIPPDSAILAEVSRAAHSHADLYPLLSRAEFPAGDPAVVWLEADDAERLELIRQLLDRRP